VLALNTEHVFNKYVQEYVIYIINYSYGLNVWLDYTFPGAERPFTNA
jgi:hypothetical protein